MVVAGETLSGADIQALRTRIESGALASGAGTYRTQDIASAYLDRIVGDVRLARPLQIAVDCGNGVAGASSRPTLFRRLGCEVTEMYCDVDGTFPESPSGPVAAREPRRPDRARRRRTGSTSASRSTATATGSAS